MPTSSGRCACAPSSTSWSASFAREGPGSLGVLPGSATAAPPVQFARTVPGSRPGRGGAWSGKCSGAPANAPPGGPVTGSHRHGPVDPQQGRVLPFSADRTQARPPPRFPGFERLSFSVRTCWDYAWRESAVTNGERDPVKSGVVRIPLAAPLEVDFGPPGDVAMFEVVCSAKSGE